MDLRHIADGISYRRAVPFSVESTERLRRRERVAEFFPTGFEEFGIVDVGFHQVGRQQLIYHPGSTRHPFCSRPVPGGELPSSIHHKHRHS